MNNLSTEATYTAYDASDAVISMITPWDSKVVTLGSACLFSYNNHRDKYPVTSTSEIITRGFVNGHRTIVGNLGFRLINYNLLEDICKSYTEYMGLPSVVRMDELPPFSLLVVKTNAEGAYKRILLEGVCYQDDGKTIQIDETTVVWVTSFIALSISEDGKTADTSGSTIKVDPTANMPEPKNKSPFLSSVKDILDRLFPNPLNRDYLVTMYTLEDPFALSGAVNYIGSNPVVVNYTPCNNGGYVLISSMKDNVITPAYSYYVPVQQSQVTGYVSGILPGVEFSMDWISSDKTTRNLQYAQDTANLIAKAISSNTLSFNTEVVMVGCENRADYIMSYLLNEFIKDPQTIVPFLNGSTSTVITGAYSGYSGDKTYYSDNLPLTPSSSGVYTILPYTGKFVGTVITSEDPTIIKNNTFGCPFLFPYSCINTEQGIFTLGSSCGYGYNIPTGNIASELVRIAFESGINSSHSYLEYLRGNITLEELYNSCYVGIKSCQGNYMKDSGIKEQTDFCYAGFWLMAKALIISGVELPLSPDVLEITPTSYALDKVMEVISKDMDSTTLNNLGLAAPSYVDFIKI